MPGQEYYVIVKKKEIVLPKDSLIIGPFPVRKTMDKVWELRIGDIIDDTIIIVKNDSTSIKKDIYNLSNWKYNNQEKSRYWKFLYWDKLKYREYDQCTMRFVINKEDL